MKMFSESQLNLGPIYHFLFEILRNLEISNSHENGCFNGWLIGLILTPKNMDHLQLKNYWASKSHSCPK
jgi:hypothetical protein